MGFNAREQSRLAQRADHFERRRSLRSVRRAFEEWVRLRPATEQPAKYGVRVLRRRRALKERLRFWRPIPQFAERCVRVLRRRRGLPGLRLLRREIANLFETRASDLGGPVSLFRQLDLERFRRRFVDLRQWPAVVEFADRQTRGSLQPWRLLRAHVVEEAANVFK